MGAINPAYILKTKKFQMKPERLVSGLLHVQVKHEVQDQGGGGDLDVGEIDVNYAYNKYWNTSSTPESPNGVPDDGDYPFLDGGVADTGAQPSYHSSDANFTNSRKVNVSDVPVFNGSDVSNVSNTDQDKTLSLGDYDSFLFFVTCGMHLENSYYPTDTVKHTPEGSLTTYYSQAQSHEKCQSFVKSHLISRINNTRNAEHSYGSDEDHSMFKQGMPIAEFTNYGVFEGGAGYTQPATGNEGAGQHSISSAGGLGGTPSHSSPYYTKWLVTNGVHENEGFGLDLRTESNFFSPVYKILIDTDHTLGSASNYTISGVTNPATSNTTWQNVSGQTHTIDSYNLAVNIYLWAYENPSAAAYTKNRVNVLWQPFGETSDLGVET